jgi:hypothetical protein
VSNALYCGDNLGVLRNREHFPDQSIDLIYLDPPLNSNASYNVLFKGPAGQGSGAQIEAFEDTWHWGEAAEDAFDQVMHSRNVSAADMLRAIRSGLGENDMMAYLAMMAVRLIELRRVLKPSGSLFLHCDPTASHYLKVLLDSIFGAINFRNQIVWKRTTSHNDAKNKFSDVADTLLFAISSPHARRPDYSRTSCRSRARARVSRRSGPDTRNLRAARSSARLSPYMMPVSRAYACVSEGVAAAPQSPRRTLDRLIIPVHRAGLARVRVCLEGVGRTPPAISAPHARRPDYPRT